MSGGCGAVRQTLDGRYVQCELAKGHSGDHAAVTWPADPRWRQLVNEAHLRFGDGYQFRTVTGRVLGLLSDIEETIGREPGCPERQLAQIVALCERLAGDGWRAKGHDVNAGDLGEWDVWRLLHWWQMHWWQIDDEITPACWKNLGDGASHWLACLTGETS